MVELEKKSPYFVSSLLLKSLQEKLHFSGAVAVQKSKENWALIRSTQAIKNLNIADYRYNSGKV